MEGYRIERSLNLLGCRGLSVCIGNGRVEITATTLPEPFKVTCPNCRGCRNKNDDTYSAAQETIYEIKIQIILVLKDVLNVLSTLNQWNLNQMIQTTLKFSIQMKNDSSI
ncbi:hypothetical protein DES34_103133 [Brevibacillus brevis]|nr:hypothetical protein DES34_103133 [Brevibacillus brevis]TQK73744.1 hypothetical protein FB479_102378 [Brevibacillus sp. AG162]VEF90494.1 Uncharacterised protein [Brevibacillus brevis]